jgi:hypothetical protein
MELYVVGGHGAQLAAPMEDENEPAGQAAQPAAEAVPGLVTVP